MVIELRHAKPMVNCALKQSGRDGNIYSLMVSLKWPKLNYKITLLNKIWWIWLNENHNISLHNLFNSLSYVINEIL